VSRLGDKIRVERLDTARLARIEQTVLAARELPDARLRGRPGWLRAASLVAAACALALVAGGLGWWLRGPARGGAAAAGPAPVPAITTGPGESATVAVGDAIVTIAESSQVSIRTRRDGRIDLDLERGLVDCDVTPRPGRPIFAVHAADVDVAVVGTAFSVARRGTDVTVKVSRGKVSVTRAGLETFVAAGEAWPAETQIAAVEPDRDPDRAPDPHPHPDPGADAQPQKTGHGQRTTGNGQPESGKATSKTTGVKPPAGLPPLAACSGSPDPIAECVRQGVRPGVDNAPALYTAIYLEVTERKFASALTHADLYDKRFQRRRPREADAVRELRRIAGGE
jgi:hypothetical protein